MLAVERATDYAQTGRWTVRWRDGTSNGAEHSGEFDVVVMAQGHHARPKLVEFKGQEKFQGRIMHSHDYKDSKDFEVHYFLWVSRQLRPMGK